METIAKQCMKEGNGLARFEIKEEFYLNQQPFKILSGAIHYFRIQPDDWYHSLYNLKALGFNTVETYIPWNAHEPMKGQFDFEGILDVEKFLQTAQDLGLYVLLRSSPPSSLENHSAVRRSSGAWFSRHAPLR